ncbi:MAG: threonylcarbamoyl-AMP synthase [Verrucomicrobiae bacterium]|nr:threonylcarbamoyl-AMP synthase [Verrucomicrobiae bacterium]
MPSSQPPSIATFQRAVKLLKQGELVVMPTETVYGLAADAFNSQALEKIFALKKRPYFDPLILHIHNESQLKLIIKKIPPAAKKLIKAFWPGPLTLVLPANKNVPLIARANLPTVAVRMPRHPIARRLLKKFGNPLAAPSANRFGRISPTSSQAVKKEFGTKTPLMLEGGSCHFGLESTIIHFSKNKPEVLRLGSITIEQIEKVLKHPVPLRKKPTSKQPLASGQLLQHYAPKKPLTILPTHWRQNPPAFKKSDALLLFRKSFPHFPGQQIILSSKGSLKTAARKLYHSLRKLDETPTRHLYVEKFPDHHLGVTLNDRLQRASHS